jgi:branched-chain amino acid transport system substrate-binding protein
MSLPSRGRFVGTIAGVTAAATIPPVLTRAAAPATVRIGYIESMSGPFADVAERQLAGVRVAVEEANRRGGTQFEIVLADDGANGDLGVTAGRRLLEQDKVDAIMIGVFSPTALGVGPIAGQRGVFVLCIQPQDTRITGTLANRVVFRLVPNALMTANTLSRRMLAVGKKWYFLQADFAFGKDGYSRLSTLLQRAGGTEVGHDVFPISASDFSSLLTKVRNSDAQVLMICHGGRAAAAICKQMVQFGLHKRMHVGTMNLEDYYGDLPLDELHGRLTAGIMWSPKVSDSAQRLYRKLGAALRGTPVSQRHYLGYIAASQLIDRMRAAGTTRADALVSAFSDHTFDAAKLRPAIWRECDHQCAGDTYAGLLVDANTYQRTGLLYDVVADVSGQDALGACTEADAAAAHAAIAKQTVPQRADYSPVAVR